MPVAHASPGCMDWFPCSRLGVGITMAHYTWDLDFGLFWILADVPSCYQKVAFELAFHLRCLAGRFWCFSDGVYLVKFSLWLIALYHLLMRYAISSV
jgi:hypothetical protein